MTTGAAGISGSQVNNGRAFAQVSVAALVGRSQLRLWFSSLLMICRREAWTEVQPLPHRRLLRRGSLEP